MRKRYVYLALIVIIVGGGGYLAYTTSKVYYESKAYADEAIPAIVADWSVDEFVRRANPELPADKRDDLRRVFTMYSRQLGPLVEYHGSQGNASVTATAVGQSITANYTAQARFKNGDASIQVVLQKIDDVWKMSNFSVTTPGISPASHN